MQSIATENKKIFIKKQSSSQVYKVMLSKALKQLLSVMFSSPSQPKTLRRHSLASTLMWTKKNKKKYFYSLSSSVFIKLH